MDPVLGRLSIPQTLDRFVYCVNNPLLLVDPSGCYPMIYGSLAKTQEMMNSADYSWLVDNWQTIAIVAICVVATVATAGIASPIWAIAGGAAIGSLTNVGMNIAEQIQRGGPIDWADAAGAGVQGAILGAAGAFTGGLSSIAFKESSGFIGAAAEAFGKLGPVGKALSTFGIGGGAGDVAYLAGESTKMVASGGKEGGITGPGLVFNFFEGGFSNAAAYGLSKVPMSSGGLSPGPEDLSKGSMSYTQVVASGIAAADINLIQGIVDHFAKPFTE